MSETLRLFDWLLGELQELHASGQLHLRLRPDNLVPFEQLRHADSDDDRYLSPEQLGLVREPVGPASDLYAVGLLLRQELTGKTPVRARPNAPPLVLGSPFSRGLEDLLARLQQLDPKDRYQSAASLRLDLKRAFSDPEFVPCEPRTRLAPPALVGRRFELERLLATLARGGKLQLTGPSGIGKSRLADELAAYAADRGLRVLRARSRTSFVPLDLLTELSQQILSQDAPFRERLARELGSAPPGLPALAPLLGQAPRGPEWALNEGSRAALTRLFACLGPALVVLDDLQWASASELEALKAARAGDRTMLLLLAHEPLDLDCPALSLGSLGERECHALIGSMAGPVDPAASTRVQALSDGNPLLVVELLRELTVTGSLVHSDETWRLRPGTVPSTETKPRVEAVLRRRLEQLGPATVEMLRAAALLGSELDPILLGQIAVTDGLEAALEARMLISAGDRLVFSHERLRETLLKDLSPDERRQLHERAAAHVLEDHELAYHLHGAGRIREAYPHALKAAADARARFNMQAAEFFLLIAAQAQEDPDLLEALGDVRRLLGRWEPADEAYARALGLRQDSLGRARVLGRMADVAFQSSRLERARAHVEQALRLLKTPLPRAAELPLALAAELARLAGPFRTPTRPLSDEDRLAAQLLDQLAYVLAFRDGFGLIWANLRGLNLTRRALPSPELASACSSHAVALLYVPQLVKRAHHFGQLGVELQERYGDTFTHAQALGRQASLELFSGSLQKSEELGRRALAVFQRTGGRWDLFMTAYNLALNLYRQGRLRESLQLARDNFRGALRVDAFTAVLSLKVIGRIGALPTRWQEEIDPGDHPNVQFVYAEVRALEHLQQGRPAAAAEAYGQALRIARQLGAALDLPPLLAWQSQALRKWAYGLGPGAAVQRRELLRQARRNVREGLQICGRAYPAYRPRLLREAAWLALERGHTARCRGLFQEGLEAARALGSRYQEALLLLDLAEVGAQQGWPGNPRYQALRLLADTGRGWEVESTEPFPLLTAHLLEWGRAVANSLTHAEAIETTRLAAEQLLMAQARAPTGNHPEVAEPALIEGGMLLPLWAEGRLVTMLHLLSRAPFGDTELQVARFLAAVAGGALENATRVEAIRDRETRFRALFGGAGVGIALLDGAGVVRESNATLQEMLGSELDGREFQEFIYREDRPAFRAHWETLEEGGTFSLEQRHLGPHQNLLWADLRVTSLGGENGVVISLADVSSRRLNQIAKFQESERRLLATEVHDAISQPLVALRFRLEAAAGEDAAGTLGMAAAQTLQVLNLARSLMSDLRTPTFEEVDLGGALVEYLREFEQLWGVRVWCEIGSDLGLVEGVSAVFAYRMLTEACINVRRHARAGVLRLRVRRRAGRLRGTVADDGAGFDLKTVTSRRYGLKGVRERAELLGGWARVRSRVGGGTVVSFEIPVRYGE